MTELPELPALRSERKLSLMVVWALALASIAASILIVTPAPFIDDTFIGVRYAENWANGHGVLYNPGEYPVEGYTSIGWVTLFFIAIKSGLEPLFLTQVVNVMSAVATLFVLFALGRQAGRSSFQALFAPLLLAFHISFVTYPMMGMTTSTFTLWMTLVTLMVVRGVHETVKGSLLLGFVLVLFSLTRFDGLGFSIGILLYPIVFERRWKKVVPAFLVLLVCIGAYNAWRIGYYGELLPNSHTAKDSEDFKDLKDGIAYLKRFFLPGGPYPNGGPFGLLLFLAPMALWRGSKAVRVATWMCGGHLVYTLYVGGDWMECFRFMLHILPLYCFLMQEGLWRITDVVIAAGAPAKATLVGTLVVMAVLFDTSMNTLASSAWTGDRKHLEASPFWNNEQAFVIGNFLDETLPPDCVVATEWAGIIPSCMRQPILDIFGLNDKEIIENQDPDFIISNMGRGITPEYLAQRAPEVMVVVGRVFPTEAAAEAGLDARPSGTWVQGFYTALMAPEIGYVPVIVKIGEKAYWPCLLHPDSELIGSFGKPLAR